MKSALLILIFALMYSNIFFIKPDYEFIGDGGDSYEYFGFMHLAKENILAGKHPFAPTDTLRYPVGFDFSYGFDGAFAVLTGALMSIFINPILSYNLTIVLILFMNLFLGYVFFKKIGLLQPFQHNLEIKAFSAALVFGASPYVFARLNGHLNLAFVAGFPVLMYSLAALHTKVVQKRAQLAQKDLYVLLIGVLLLALGSLQYIILLALITPILIAVTINRVNLDVVKSHIIPENRKLFLPILYFIIVFLFLFGGYIKGLLTRNLVHDGGFNKFYQPHFMDVLVPNRYLGDFWRYINPSEMSIEKVITMGMVEMALLLFFLVILKNQMAKKIGLVLLVFYLVLSFGLIKVPYYPEGGRIVVILSLFLAYIIVSFDALLPKWIFSSFVLTMLLVERFFFILQTSEPLALSPIYDNVRNIPGDSVLNIPLSKYNAYRSALPVFYNKKIFDGYFHYTASNIASEKILGDRLFSRFLCGDENSTPHDYKYAETDRAETMDALKKYGTKTIVLFKDSVVGKLFSTGCDNVRDWWYWFNPLTLVINKDTQGVENNNFKLLVANPNNIFRFYFEREGTFLINGIYISPPVINDLVIELPDGTVVTPEYKPLENGYSAEFIPPIVVTARAGDFVTFRSPTRVLENRYITVFYVFQMNKESLIKQDPPIQLQYIDNDVEIYKIN